MRIIIAPDKFKGSMSSKKAAEHIARGIISVLPRAELILLPLSDGGEGLVESLVRTADDSIITTEVTGPLGSAVPAKWGVTDNGKTAVIEMAAASGLDLIPTEQRDPFLTTTFGTGELIIAALDQGCSKLIIGIGGSATNDGGAGMARALGVKFLDQSGKQLRNGGVELRQLVSIDQSGLDQRLQKVKTMVACDVENPLTGPQGASYTYGPQKGASPEMIKQLDQALENYARVIKKDLGIDVGGIPGSGAAGGMGAGLIAFLNAELCSGIKLVLDALDIDLHLPGCQLLITGEGKLDAQSTHGKAPVGAARRARKYNVPVAALAGSIEGALETFHREGITACFAIADGPLSLEESISKGPQLIEKKSAELIRLCKHCRINDPGEKILKENLQA